MTVNVDSLHLSICSCSHLPVALSLPLSLSFLHSLARLRRELLWEFSTSLFVKAYLFTDFQSNWTERDWFPRWHPHTCILACHPISAAPEPDVCFWEPILVPLEHNNVQFYRLSFNIYTDGKKNATIACQAKRENNYLHWVLQGLCCIRLETSPGTAKGQAIFKNRLPLHNLFKIPFMSYKVQWNQL